MVREGDPASHLFNITSGSVRVYKLMADGRRQIVGFLYTGDFLGLATGDSYAFSAEALEPVTACRFRKSEYRKLLQEQPTLESALLERASHELAAAQDQMLLLGRKTALERFASFLLDTARRQRRTQTVELSMTRAEIADYLGLTTETVSRVTSKLKTSGMIRLVSLSEIALLKPAALAEIADGG
jgi:CRP/FNR family transcriptional regulator